MANDITRIRRDTIAEITRQLEAARRRIIQRLAVTENAQTQERLKAMQADVAYHLEVFRRQATGTAVTASAQAVRAGMAQVTRPLAAAGINLTPHINPRALTSMRVALTDLIGDVSTTTKNRINAQLAQVLIGTQDLSGAVTRVQQVIGSSRRRAQTIMYTELGRINNAAAQASMEEAVRLLPGMKKRWVKSGKKHPRQSHVGAHGQVREVHEPFLVGGEALMYPGDPNGSAGNTINCGCMSIPVVDGSSWGKSTAALDMDTPGAPLTMHRDPDAPVPEGAITLAVTGLSVVQAQGGILGAMDATPLALRDAWPSDFPAITLHATERLVKSHPDYAAAKAGDFEHAARLIEALINREAIDTLARQHHATRPLLVPVWAEESDGKNIIPRALAQYISTVTGWGWDDSIIQANRVHRTGKDDYYRLAVQPLFDGQVQAGAAYLMVDDFLGQGATLANLRGYIQRRGGRVVGGTALTGKPESAILALSPATLTQLRAIHGNELEHWWRERFGFGFEQLTESEARYLIARTDADRVRAEILARLGQGG